MSKGYQLDYSVLFLTSTKKATTQYGVAFLVSIISLYQSAIILNHFAGLNVSLPALKNSQLEQLNSEFFAWLPTRFSALKIDHLIKQIGITYKRLQQCLFL